MAAFISIILPLGYNFNPDLVLVSAGFDAAQGDPLGEYQVSPQAYGQMTHMLGSLAGGKIILTLEVNTMRVTMICNINCNCKLLLLGWV